MGLVPTIGMAQIIGDWPYGLPQFAASKRSFPELVCGKLRVEDPIMENVALNGMRVHLSARKHVAITNVDFTYKM